IKTLSTAVPSVGTNLGLWGSQGTTYKRNVLDQQVNPGAIAGNNVQIGTQKLSTSGYLRSVEIDIPPVAGTLTLGGGTFVYTANQFPAARIVRQFQLSVANVNNLINVNGIGLGVLKYVRAGNCAGFDGASSAILLGIYAVSTSIGAPNPPNIYPALQ